MPPATCHPLPSSSHPLPATRYLPPATRYQPPVTCHPLPVTRYLSPHTRGKVLPKRSGLHYNFSQKGLKNKEKKRKAKTHHLIQHAIQPECAKTHQTNPVPQANNATQIKRNCKDAQPQHKKQYRPKCFAISRFFHTLSMTCHKMTTSSS